MSLLHILRSRLSSSPTKFPEESALDRQTDRRTNKQATNGQGRHVERIGASISYSRRQREGNKELRGSIRSDAHAVISLPVVWVNESQGAGVVKIG